jgi:hypothetical protein
VCVYICVCVCVWVCVCVCVLEIIKNNSQNDIVFLWIVECFYVGGNVLAAQCKYT